MTVSRSLPWLGKLAAAALALAFIASPALADDDDHDHDGHSDIEFEYHNGMIEIHDGPIFEAEFPTEDYPETGDPGFNAHDGDLNADDTIDYYVLGPLRYHNGTEFLSVPSGMGIRIVDKPASGSEKLLIDADTEGPITNSNGKIGDADEHGGLHTHIDFALEGFDDFEDEEDAYGAYGIDMELFTDADGIDNSDPFTIVFNYGMDHEDFETAAGDFATTAIPEPGTAALAGMIAAVTLVRRRRRRSAR